MDTVQNLSIIKKECPWTRFLRLLLINRAIAWCSFFNPIFALFLFLFISHYFKKGVHGPHPSQGVHGPGP